MSRIFEYKDTIIDLGNIKQIQIENLWDKEFGGTYYVHIHLLTGNEFVLNTETEKVELITPTPIRFSFNHQDKGIKFKNELKEAWEKYLEN